MRGSKSYRSPWILVILLIVGGVIGSFLGVTLGKTFPLLNKAIAPVGLNSTTLDLGVLSITFGFLLKLNLASIIGFILAYLAYRKM